MLNYWTQLKPRERLMVSVAGGVLGVIMLYLLLLEPFMIKADELTVRVAKQQKEVQWLKQASLEVAQLQRNMPGNTTSARAGQSLLVVVDRTAKQFNLADSMKRVEPDGSSRVRVWLEKASFDEVAKWMAQLETQYQLHVESAVIDKTEDTGRINARLVFLGAES
jgi:general secretion pathway protein M